MGENLEDEWYITYLLFQVSERLSLSWGLSIETWDLDGQFLLIEAADSLPSWLIPENSKHRVWIRGGKLHVINLKQLAGNVVKVHV